MSDRLGKMSYKQIIKSMFAVVKTAFGIAPGVAIIKIIEAVLSSALPIITTYFAALTTTALADAYAGVVDSKERVIIYLAMTAAISALMMLWEAIRRYFNEASRYKIESTVNSRLIEHFYNIDFANYDDRDVIDYYDRARDFAGFFPYVFDRLADLFSGIVGFLMIAGVMITISPWLSFALLLVAIPGAIFQFQLSRMSSRHWRGNVGSRRRLYFLNGLISSPANIVEIRLYGLVRHLLKLRKKLRDQDQKTRIDFERRFILRRFLADLLIASVQLGSLIWVVIEIAARRQPVGQFLFVQQNISRAMASLSGVTFSLSSLGEDIAGLSDYEKIVNLPVLQAGGIKLDSLSESIKVSDVDFRYPRTKNNVLKDISMEIKKGQRVAVVGENGAGKTTLLKLLIGLYRTNKGNITVDGNDLANVDISTWHHQISVLGQDFIRYDFATADENVWFGDISKSPTLRPKLVREAMIASESLDFVQKLPDGGESYVDKWMESDDGKSSINLSGGQWQRLALARNFYRNSPVVILDEPTSSIDALAESRIFRRLFRQTDKTIIVVSHRLTTVKLADIIYLLEECKIVEKGSHQDLVAKKGAYYQMFKSQLGVD